MAARSEHKDLLPDRDVAVRLAGGETITVRVRAYRAAEYFEVRPLARPVLDALAALDLDASEDTEYLLDAAWAVLAEHADTMRALVLLAVDRPLDLGEVTAESFQGLFYAVLDANHPFFLALLEERRTLLTLVVGMLRQSLTGASLPSSSAPASAGRH
ncbi:MAG: hypothetical protein L0H83_12820 [Salinisphaera sp.]|nr:hypothetical protein [Salinisphaera sp.]